MQIIFKRTWQAIDGSKAINNKTSIPPGTHEVERIPNPLGYKGNWLVLKGTKIGASEPSWRQWNGPEFDEFEVIIVE